MSPPQYTYEDYMVLHEDLLNINEKDMSFHLIYIKDIIERYIIERYTKNSLNTSQDISEFISIVMLPLYKKIMFDTPFEEIPLELNSKHIWYDYIIKWRLKIGK